MVKTMIVGNIIMRSVFFICVTVAAIAFEKTGILWWYILGALMALDFKSRSKSNDKD